MHHKLSDLEWLIRQFSRVDSHFENGKHIKKIDLIEHNLQDKRLGMLRFGQSNHVPLVFITSKDLIIIS